MGRKVHGNNNIKSIFNFQEAKADNNNAMIPLRAVTNQIIMQNTKKMLQMRGEGSQEQCDF